ncbi:NAD(P)-dependent oxidoreductase [Synechococcus sp. CS-1328]|uniref:NAD(P)-dependent oxidoreductase n=1 Tax=Synechococcus sp. CS-1328 TaxID=2847976 RepID=UPI00223B7A45|nr:NAD(P)-dependent oxidoreductase [Synechococcus sp. CS-1328]MCT0224808.1 NAD(P)-dependent oxidoreductase [Synechococcus sp. CS-1328]
MRNEQVVQSSDSPLPSVAFLGLGQLGTPMAANLLAAGFPLTVHNRTRTAEEPLAAAGAARACSPADAAATAEILCLCLTDGAAVDEVLFGHQGAAAALPAGGLVIDFSTIDPSQAKACHDRLRLLGLDLVDAPVTGGTEGAKAGTLSVLVGGADATVDRARPLLQAVGRTVTHFGPIGSGQQVKAVNQVLVAGSYAAAAEAMALGQRLGLPMELVRQALSGGAAGSWALEHRATGMLEGRFPLGFKLSLHRKDLAIALGAAAASDLNLPISERVAAMEDSLIEAGFGEEDVSALARWFTQ